MRTLITTMAALFAVAGCSGPGAAADPPFAMQELARFNQPWALAFLPDGSALVTEKAGTMKHWRPDGQVGTIDGLPKVAKGGQGGLLDVELAPDFEASRLVYFTYSEPSAAGGRGLALARGRLDGEALGDVRVLWHDPQGGGGGQFGAVIAFAPDGKSLFLSSGERQRFTPAQDAGQPIGKILHLTLDGKPASGNPWAGMAGPAQTIVIDPPRDTEAAKATQGRTFTWQGPNPTPAETWSTGHRNPYGLAFAPDGRLWETEMGPRGGDELNLIEKGRNYGWPLVSEGENYNGVGIAKPASRPDLAPPKLFWVPSISPTTLLFYSGTMFEEWKGNALIGSLSGNSLVRVGIDGAHARKLDRWDLGIRIRFVAEGADGAVYLLEDGEDGRLLKLTPAP